MLLDRSRFAHKHLAAFLTGEFFRRLCRPGTRVGAMDAFQQIGWIAGASKVLSWPRDHPAPPRPQQPDYSTLMVQMPPKMTPARLFVQFVDQELSSETLTQCRRLLENSGLEGQVQSEGGLRLLLADLTGRFGTAVESWLREYDSIAAEWNRLANEPKPDRRAVNYLRYQANSLWSTTVIEELATRGLLPRYGFPIGVLSLTHPGKKFHRYDDEPVRLERSGILALGEYVLGSVVLAGGRYNESHGLVRSYLKDDKAFGPIAKKWSCAAGHSSYRFEAGQPSTCTYPDCGKQLSGRVNSLLFVRYGFSTAAWDPPAWQGKAERVGTVSIGTTAFVTRANETIAAFGGVSMIRAYLCEDGEVLVDNSGERGHGFSICTQCGYAASELKAAQKGALNLPAEFIGHTPLDRLFGKCLQVKDSPAPLRNVHLAARQNTDLLRIELATASAGITIAFGHACVLSASELLDLDPRELGVFAEGNCVILYESSAGGCGHMAELVTQAASLLQVALRRLYVSERHNELCEYGCLACILTPRSQHEVEKRLADRRAAVQYLQQALSA